MSDYLIDRDRRDARQRLTVLERLQDPVTIELLEQAGVAAGWSCLEAGAGGGSIAAWLVDRVRPSGRVVATDLDPGFLEPLECEQLEVRRHDLVTDDLERERFDLVHARNLLIHLPRRERALRKLADAVRPGGWILLEEPDHVTDGPDPTASEQQRRLYRTVTAAIYAFLRRRGLRPDYGAALPGEVRRLGFEPVRAEGRCRVYSGVSGSSESPHLPAFVELRDPVVEAGAVSGQQFDAFLELTREPDFSWRETLTVSVLARRPRR